MSNVHDISIQLTTEATITETKRSNTMYII